MERILIVGAGGSGKTTFARALSGKTGLPVVHLDAIYWTGRWEHLTREEFSARIEEELQKPRWIMDGNYQRTFARRAEFCDCILYLDFSPIVCVFSVLKRKVAYHGRTRPDMGGNCPERLDVSFLKWVLTYRRKIGPETLRLIQESGKEYRIFKNRKQLKQFLNSLPFAKRQG